jgi:hypothetical protein
MHPPIHVFPLPTCICVLIPFQKAKRSHRLMQPFRTAPPIYYIKATVGLGIADPARSGYAKPGCRRMPRSGPCRSPFEAIAQAWTKDPSTFKINPRHLIPGPNTYTL